MSIKEIKKQIHLFTTVKLMLEIDNRKLTNEDETYLIKLKCKLYNVNTNNIG